MKFIFRGNYKNEESALPTRVIPEGSVLLQVYGNDDITLMIVLIVSLYAIFVLLNYFFLHTYTLDFAGELVGFCFTIVHEYIHALCFKCDVHCFADIKHFRFFVIGTETMSRRRMLITALLPSALLGFIPYAVFILTKIPFAGAFGAISICGGVGDYALILSILIKVPRRAEMFLSGIDTYWILPQSRFECF